MANPLDDEELDTNKLIEQVEAAAQTDPTEPPIVVAPEKKSP